MAPSSSFPPRAANLPEEFRRPHGFRPNRPSGGLRSSTIRRRAEHDAPPDHFAADPPRYAPSALDAAGDIPLALKRRILNAYHGLEGRNHYELLGVDPRADRRTLRNAYFALAKIFHPDSQFGTDLGAFKSKMETVFKRLTDAYDVLGPPRKRAQYDEQLCEARLATGVRTRPDVDRISDPTTQPSGIRRIERDADAQPNSLVPRSADERRARMRDRRRRL